MRDSLISIIVPVFNIETYISECIESIQNQTYQNLQIILVDDGSTDQSGSICDCYAMTDSRIEVIHQCNHGLVMARKVGLEKAKGEYIGFVDGDDYIEPDMYLFLKHNIDISEADFVHSGYWENHIKKMIFSKQIIDLRDVRENFLTKFILGEGNCITPSIWSKLFKADLLRESYSQVCNSCSFGEDVLALTLCILNCNKISIADGCHYHYRIREGSLSHENNINDLKKIYKLYENLCNIFCSYGVYNNFEAVMNNYLWNNVINYIARINQNDFQIARYYFKDVEKLYGKRIIIYGAGGIGRDYYAQICRYSDCEVAAWVDAYPERYQYRHIKLYGLEVLDSMEFDMLIIAVLRETVANDIYSKLIERGIDKEKIYWSNPERWAIR